MANTPEKPAFIDAPIHERDPLYYRHGLSRVQYASPMQRFAPARRALSSRAAEYIGCVVLGLTLGLLFASFV